MVSVSVTVCDVCGEVGRDTSTYRVENKDTRQQGTFDLCSRHAQPLETLLNREAPAAVAPARRAGRKPRALKVTTLDEIEAKKGRSED